MELPFTFISLFLFLAFVLSLIKGLKRLKTTQKLPPSPWKLPLIGHMHHLVGSPSHQGLRDLARKHGALMHLQMGEIPSIVVSSPRLAEEIMKTHDLSFADRAEFLSGKIVGYNCTDIASCQYGDYWRQMRKICTLELLSVKRVRSYGSIRQEEASVLVASIKALASAGELINVTEKLTSYTSSTVCRAAFGRVSKDNYLAFLPLVREINSLSGSFNISDQFPSLKILHPLMSLKTKLLDVHHKADRVLDHVIEKHIAKTEPAIGETDQEDLVDVLLRVKGGGNLQFPITNDNIKAVIMDIFLGGTETSSTTVEWTMSELMRNPRAMVKAQREVRKAFVGKKTIEETDIQELKYLKSVIKETLRLHPPVPLLVPRECRQETEIDGYIIPIKTRVIVNAWAIGRDPEYWDDPESFKPERFEDSSVDFSGCHFQYVPFGAGRRICPGISFGLANVELPLALLLYHFDWKLPNGLKPNDLDMTETMGVTAPRKDNLRLLATVYDASLDVSAET
ncbi:premnaspirodiene oxygenase-like [Coffea eugenioides]|uniref:premnaspirodiene oxygenase-like n=1 Tax=Coffea eugenioides TaxID=49369 RepID=UPI000F60F223|nr:premnaspirodiene oxygenase-like [Coffea eugenioides]